MGIAYPSSIPSSIMAFDEIDETLEISFPGYFSTANMYIEEACLHLHIFEKETQLKLSG